jgi:hypothetical protein
LRRTGSEEGDFEQNVGFQGGQGFASVGERH